MVTSNMINYLLKIVKTVRNCYKNRYKINYLISLGKSWLSTTSQQAFESHIPMLTFQMPFRILDVRVAKITSVLVLNIVHVPWGLKMVLCFFAIFVPKETWIWNSTYFQNWLHFAVYKNVTFGKFKHSINCTFITNSHVYVH